MYHTILIGRDSAASKLQGEVDVITRLSALRDSRPQRVVLARGRTSVTGYERRFPAARARQLGVPYRRPSSSQNSATAFMPVLKFSSLIHSFGAWAFSPGSPKPISSTGLLSKR
jgi:hypothetical protein